VTGANAAFAAGILHMGTTLQMTDCTVAGNTAMNDNGGGLAVVDGCTLEMTRCTVRDNHATRISGNFGFGGGIFTRGPVTLTDCLVENNSGGAFGGGIRLEAGGTTTLVGSTTVQANVAGLGGGGIDALGRTFKLVIAETCLITRNTAPTGGGGGIHTLGGTVTLEGAAMPSPIVVDNCHENCAGSPVNKCSPDPPTSPCP
jgi:hypothetical protein